MQMPTIEWKKNPQKNTKHYNIKKQVKYIHNPDIA